MKNSLIAIFPYKYEGTWVFDDEHFDLVKEPFVFGIPEMIEELVTEVENAEKGFKLIFSQKPFPGFQMKINWLREECEGNWYELEGTNEEGWLCPALMHYFESPPIHIYAKAETK
ncbi:DUF6717 family protein [Kangiella sp. HZ709]|uniref:DUF6717 family protein n=1 Tax=Kangiella sp. HZ709 TaxID=2666328 RepID=UPI0012AF08C2|nr:DUF6717 family protein [Kangiella sp. HZ709]MRX27294.1 hypothetical protein [Kangiella sp. HZ709]